MSTSPEQKGCYYHEHKLSHGLSPFEKKRIGAAVCAVAVLISSTAIEMQENTKTQSVDVHVAKPEQQQFVTPGGFIQHEVNRFIADHRALQLREVSQTEVTILREEPVIDQLAPVIEKAADMHAIDPNLLTAIAWNESCGHMDPGVSSSGAQGFMQIMPATASDMMEKNDINEYNPRDPHDSVMMAATVISTNKEHYLPNMIDSTYLEDPDTAIEILAVSYNWGIGGAQRFIESGFDRSILPAETADYLIEADYLLEEEPNSGENTRCHGNPQAG